VNTVGRAPHRIEEFRACRGLQQVADRARLHRVEHVLLFPARGQDQHAHRRMGRAQAASHLDAGHVRQLQVEHDDVRPGRAGDAQRLCAVSGRRDDVVSGFGQVSRNRVAPHRVVIHHHDPDRRVLPHVRTLARPRGPRHWYAGPARQAELHLGALTGYGTDGGGAAQVA
jgi:hypothetical protein